LVPTVFFNETTGANGDLSFFTVAARLGLVAHVAQLAEHILGKDEVISSSLIMGSRFELSAVAWLRSGKSKNIKHSRKRNGKRNVSTDETAREHRHDWPY
jgi:hypothetical protein